MDERVDLLACLEMFTAFGRAIALIDDCIADWNEKGKREDGVTSQKSVDRSCPQTTAVHLLSHLQTARSGIYPSLMV